MTKERTMDCNEGIAIQSTFNKLVNSLNQNNLSIHFGIVEYIDYDNDRVPSDNLFHY